PSCLNGLCNPLFFSGLWLFDLLPVLREFSFLLLWPFGHVRHRIWGRQVLRGVSRRLPRWLSWRWRALRLRRAPLTCAWLPVAIADGIRRGQILVPGTSCYTQTAGS